MKRRITPILTITLALVLFTGLAYAVEKKKKGKAVAHIPEAIPEEEALKAELLEATGEHQKKMPGEDIKKGNDRGYTKKERSMAHKSKE